MKNNKLIKVLKLLSKPQIKRLKEFVETPYFNKDSQVIDLFAFFNQYAPEYEVEKKRCFQSLFPKDQYDDLKLRRLLSKAFKLLEKFLVIEEIEMKPAVKHQTLAAFYKKRLEKGLFEQEIKAWQKAVKELNWDEQNVADYLIANYLRDFKGKEALHKPSNKTEKNFLKAYEDHREALKNFILRNIFAERAWSGSYNKTVNWGKEEAFYKKVATKLVEIHQERPKEELVEWNQYLRNQIPYLLFKIIIEENQEAYQELKTIIQKQAESIPDVTLHETLVEMTFYTRTSYAKTRDIAFAKEHFEALKLQLKHKLVFGNGYFNLIAFMNMVTVGLKVGEVEWIENFLQKYIHQIDPKLKQEVSNICYARLAYEKGNFETAVDLYEQRENQHWMDKKYQMLSYYELQDFEKLDPLMNNFRVIIFRDQRNVSDIIKHNQKFINVLIRLVNTPKSNKEKLQKIKQYITENSPIAEEEWLLAKLKEKI